jgi:hypothetical protein
MKNFEFSRSNLVGGKMNTHTLSHTHTHTHTHTKHEFVHDERVHGGPSEYWNRGMLNQLSPAYES